MNPIVLISIIAGAVASAFSATIIDTITYPSSVTRDNIGWLDLKAELNYNDAKTKAPIVVLIHGFTPATGNYETVRGNAQYLRDTSCFCISPAMRGRDESDGVRDCGGLEVYDLWDAIEYVKRTYPTLVDSTRVYLFGNSAGGGWAMSFAVRFPDYVNVFASFFGMSDFGYNTTTGWFFYGAQNPRHTDTLIRYVGNPRLPRPDTTSDKYMARAAQLASRNNPHTESHLFYLHDEPICPGINDTLYRNLAVAHQKFNGEFNNIHLHSGDSGVYEDFNHNGVNESSEHQWWPHVVIPVDMEQSAEGWFLNRFLTSQIPMPAIDSVDSFFVIGWVKTRKFSLWMGNGHNATGDLAYILSDSYKSFSLNVATINKTVKSILTVNVDDFSGGNVNVELNGSVIRTFAAVAGTPFIYDSLHHGDSLVLKLLSTRMKNIRLVSPPAMLQVTGNRISYSLAYQCRIRMSIHNLQGRKILSLIDTIQQPGAFSVILPLGALAQGTYDLRFIANGQTMTRRITVGSR